MVIKKWNGSNWVATYPDVQVGNIEASGTPSSSTFLRGDGAWAVPSYATGDITGVTAGTGLTGGGSSGSVTVNAIGGTGITANANDLAISSTFSPGTATELTSSQDLNDLKAAQAGFYYQTANVDTSGNNYPIEAAGSLIVQKSAGQVTQFYITYQNPPRMFMRTYYTSWSSWVRVFEDNYHPNADKWTTARTLSLTGAVTGSVSWDGSANASLATTATADPTLTLSGDASGSATFTNLGNATLSVTVADDSHNHVISNVDGLQTALDGKLSTSGNAATASKLQTARNISLTGDVSGLVSFDGSANVSMTTTISGAIDSSGDTMTGDLTMQKDGGSDVSSHGIIFQANNATLGGDFETELNMDHTGDLKFGTNTIFHTGNDGSASGLHADLLDGQNGSYYLDYNNFTNTPSDSDTVTSIRRDNTGTYRTGNINLMSGSGITITEVASGSFSFAASGGSSGPTYSSQTLYIKRIFSATVTSDEYTLRYNAGTAAGTAISTSSTYTSISLGYTPSSTDKFMIEFSNNTSNSVEKGICFVGHGTFSSTAGLSVLSYDGYETVDSGQLKIAKYFCQWNISGSSMRFRYGSKMVY